MKKLLYMVSLLFLVSCGSKYNQSDIKENSFLYKNGTYFVYYDKELLLIPEGTYITKNDNIENYFYSFFGKKVKDENKLEIDLSRYFPHGIKEVYELKEIPKEYKVIPTISILNGKNIIDTVKLANVLAENNQNALISVNDITNELVEIKDTNQVDPNISLEGKLVSILNANGINGFAKALGESFAKNLKMNYIATNYNKKSNISYVINHKLSKEEFNKFVNSISLKYIEIKDDPNISPDADVVLITGNDSKVNFPIVIQSSNKKSELKDLLSEYKPIVVGVPGNIKINGTTIEYNPKDIVIANKLTSYIPDSTLQENKDINGKIIILTDR